MKTALEIIEAAGGEKAVATRLGVTKDRVYRVCLQGRIPAMWFDALERMLDQELPRDLFTFVKVSASRPTG